MNKNRWSRVLGIFLVLVMLMGSFSWILPNNRIEPENPMVVFADELEIENLGLGASNSSSETNAQDCH